MVSSRPPLQALLSPLEAGKASLVAVQRGTPRCRALLQRSVRAGGTRSFLSRPPLPHEPLAPLRHLLEEWQLEWPELDQEGPLPWMFWMGLSVPRSLFWARFAHDLRACPTVVWLDYEDLQAPLLRDFFQVVRAGELHAPLTFAYLHPEGRPLEEGTTALELGSWEPSLETAHDEGELLEELSWHARALLGQALVLGDRWQPDTLRLVTRADIERRGAELTSAGVLEPTGRIVPERLRAAAPLAPPASQRWRARASRALSSLPRLRLHQRCTLLWLCPDRRKPPANTTEVSASGLLLLSGRDLRRILESDRFLPEETRFAVGLILRQLAGGRHKPDAIPALGVPWALLRESLQPFGSAEEWSAALERLQATLVEAEETEAAAWLACARLRWQLNFGQAQTVFHTLAPFQEVEPWALRWTLESLRSEAFALLGRKELSAHHLRLAANALPTPVPPVLAAQLRIASLRSSSNSRTSFGEHEQAKLARATLRAFGDTRGTARLLVLTAESEWAQARYEEARALLSRSLVLFQQAEDSSGLFEARIKLSLVLQKKPPLRSSR